MAVGRAENPVNASKDVDMGILLTLHQISKPVSIAVVGSGATCVFEAGSDRKDGSSDVCYVGDTR